MEMGAFTGALVALLAKDMASAIASEMGKDVSSAAKQALRRLGQRLRREPDTRAAMEQLETNPSDPAVQERLAEQLTSKLTDPAFREDLQALLAELDRQAAAAVAAEDPVQEERGRRLHEEGPNLVTMAMNGWGAAEPAWWLNLQAHPEAVVELAGGIRREVLGRAAVGAERERLWRRWSELDQNLDGYAARRPRATAVVVLEPRAVTE
jgi:hypothetical protein